VRRCVLRDVSGLKSGLPTTVPNIEIVFLSGAARALLMRLSDFRSSFQLQQDPASGHSNKLGTATNLTFVLAFAAMNLPTLDEASDEASP